MKGVEGGLLIPLKKRAIEPEKGGASPRNIRKCIPIYIDAAVSLQFRKIMTNLLAEKFIINTTKGPLTEFIEGARYKLTESGARCLGMKINTPHSGK